MRIMCIFYRFGQDLVGGAEALFLKLMETVASAGHQVDVYTTMSYDAAPSRDGYLVWDNQLFRPLPEQVNGVTVYRYRVKNPRPAEGRKAAAKVAERFEKERSDVGFAERMAGCVAAPGGYLLAGWHSLEDWRGERGAVRWAEPRAVFVFSGAQVSGLQLTLYSSSPTGGYLQTGHGGGTRFNLEAGVDTVVEMEVRNTDSGYCAIEMDRALRTPLDHRELGVAVKSIVMRDGTGEHYLPLRNDFQEFLRQGQEFDLSAFLWDNALRRPRSFERLQQRVIGPRSPQLERAVMKAVADYDVVLANMLPMTTLPLAARVAQHGGKPLMLAPLFHPRDPNHYWSHFHSAMAGAALVDGTSETGAKLLAAQGFRTDFISPGFDPQEFEDPAISGERFREKHGLKQDKVLLFVARKALSKRYDLAAEAVAELRRRGWPVWLVMIGPDEDRRPLMGEHILYLGRQERSEVLDAFDACDAFIMPSEAESFGMVFCEAWLCRKPVLGNASSGAVASLIEHGVDGFLATSGAEFADYAERILREPELARRMGENGYRKVRENFTWDQVGRKAERLLGELAEAGGGQRPHKKRRGPG